MITMAWRAQDRTTSSFPSPNDLRWPSPWDSIRSFFVGKRSYWWIALGAIVWLNPVSGKPLFVLVVERVLVVTHQL